MKKKYKNSIVIAVVVIMILCISLFYFLARYYNNAQHYPYKGVDLEETFLKEFPGNYSEFLWMKQDNVIVFLGVHGEKEGGCYVYYEKAPFSDRWREGRNGVLKKDSPSAMIQADGFYDSNRIYVSLNPEKVSKVAAVANEKETVCNTDPEEPFAVIMEGEIDDITFFTEDGREISEDEFLKAP